MENVVLINHNKNWGLDEKLVLKLAKKALEVEQADAGFIDENEKK